MKTLEKKHLKYYLDTGLKYQYWEGGKKPKTDTLKGLFMAGNMMVIDDKPVIGEKSHKRLNQIKPIFHPFSDLTKEIEHNGEKFVPANCFWDEYICLTYFWDLKDSVLTLYREDDEDKDNPIMVIDPANMGIVDWSIMQKLFGWNFWIFDQSYFDD